jgi:hypothetical protein
MKHKWTALFYIYAEDKNTKAFADQLERILIKIKQNSNLNLLLFRSNYNENFNKIDGELYYLQTTDGQPLRESKLLASFLDVNPGDPQLLQNVLNQIKKDKLLEGDFLFFPWDHGIGFGIFNANLWANTPFQKDESLLMIKKSNTLSSPFKVISNNRNEIIRQSNKVLQPIGATFFAESHQIHIDMLTMKEINDAIRIIGFKTAVIIMLNCWTQMLETGVEFDGTVQWLVAPETIHYFKGYDYESILNVTSNEDTDAEKIAWTAINTLPAFFKADAGWSYGLENMVVSAVRPGKSKEVLLAVKNIYENRLKTIVASDFDKLSEVRNNCFDVSLIENTNPHKFIDLLNFMTMLNREKLINPNDYSNLFGAIRNYVPYLYSPFYKDDKGIFSGFSVFHPNEPHDFSADYYDYFYRRKNLRITNIADPAWAMYLQEYGINL